MSSRCLRAYFIRNMFSFIMYYFKSLPNTKLTPFLVSDCLPFLVDSKIKFQGMTEACSSLTFKTLYDPTKENLDQSFKMIGEIKTTLDNQPGGVCVGKTAPHVELRIASEDCSHAGRILIRGPQMMLGYWGQIPSEELDPGDGGWFDTGDLGRLDDDGNVWLIGRTKGRIKSGGENVYPEEVRMKTHVCCFVLLRMMYKVLYFGNHK